MSVYTQQIEDEYWGYAQQSEQETSDLIENMDEHASRDEWVQQIYRIGKEYTCSARYFLLGYLEEISEDKTEDHFRIQFDEKTYEFPHATMEYCLDMGTAEVRQMIHLLSRIAARNSGDTIDDWTPILWRAMLRNKKVELLTREQGLMLAHGLRFSLEQAQGFLLRVLENDALQFSRSDDLIEAFCFLYYPANNHHTAEALKQAYRDKTQDVSKSEVQNKPENFTVSKQSSLTELVEEWSDNPPDAVMDRFLGWMSQMAAYLDIPSKSAWEVYTRLFQHAVDLTHLRTSEGSSEENSENLENLENLEDMEDQDAGQGIRQALTDPLDESYSHAVNVYKYTSDLLNYASNEFDNARARKAEDVWRYLYVDGNGRISAQATGKRIPDLVLGKESVTKADLLFLLWYTCDLYWADEDGEEEESEQIYNRIVDFWYLAEELLDQANLPDFYVPHLLERSFLQAIIGYQDQDGDSGESPYEIYEGLCEFVLPEKKERPGGRKSEEEKIEKNKISKASRAVLERETEDAYRDGSLDLEGTEAALLDHLLSRAELNGKYTFTDKGIFYFVQSDVLKDENGTPAVAYPRAETALRFDMTRDSYTTEEARDERFRYLYGMKLYLMDQAAEEGISANFRTSYKANCILLINQWEKEGTVENLS